MIKSFLYALVATMIFGALVGFIANLPGTLIIPVGDWQAEVELALFFALFSIFIFILWIIIYIIKNILKLFK